MKKKILFAILVIVVVVGVYHNKKSLPDNVSYESPIYQIDGSDIQFFQDVTYVDGDGNRNSEQEIFDEIFRMIDDANEYILIDMFFYSDFIGVETSSYRQLSDELTKKLIKKKTAVPDITIQVVSDPINVMYGGHISDDFEALRSTGISVTITDVRQLRDSNPLYSAFWRTGLQWFGNSNKAGWLPNPLDTNSPMLGLRTYLRMLNYKANHRKLVMTDFMNEDGRVGFSTLITSANPHDGSSAHSNVAVRVDSQVWQDILTTESAVVEFSGGDFIPPTESLLDTIVDTSGAVQVQIVTEGKIENRTLEEINRTTAAGTIDIAMFYIADQDIIRALKRADKRGVQIRLLFDPNKDAFGREKNGTPNRQVANELVQNSPGNTTVRWCDTHGEQCHSKLLLVTREDTTTLLQGSANYTKRNLQDYNLETNVVITGSSNEQVFVDAQTFFDEQWNNEEGRTYSTPYETYQDTSRLKTLVYKLQEFVGFSHW